MANKAVVAGGSGLIGSHLLSLLLDSPFYDEVVTLVRTPLPYSHPKLTQLCTSFGNPEQFKHAINGHALFCCLGTTRKKSPDPNEYKKVDQDYPVLLALLAAKSGMSQFHFVSSLGANSRSRNFYLRTKGRTEELLRQTGIRALHIYRPALLTGARKENRPLERFMARLMPVFDWLLAGPLKKYRSIPARQVALSIYRESLHVANGLFIHESDQLQLIQ